MDKHLVVSLCNHTDQTMTHHGVSIAPQHGPAALSDASGTPITCFRKKDELADPEIVGRNASGWSAGG